MARNIKIIELNDVVVKFAGDSGDGMQMSGTQFSDMAAAIGIDLSTLPDYPAEIRAPQGTIAGVSGFQIHVGKENIQTAGDKADVLIAMNPAALKANIKWVKRGALIIVDSDSFTPANLEKAGYTTDPLTDETLHLDYNFQMIKVPISSLTHAALKDMKLENKIVDKTKNQFVSGILYWLFNRDLNDVKNFIKERFKNNAVLREANLRALHTGYDYAETIEAISSTFKIKTIQANGRYRNITGNVALAWGLIAASEKSGRPLFIGSYPITPATEILQELSLRKSLGVKTFQAEDEIAGICSAIGASFAGDLAATSTSGPGLALKGEAIGLAVITELPIVIIDVQRGGPSTGMPTKTEQGDLMQALYGRSGECPCVVMAAISPAQCFEAAFHAARIALEHMTPVILLSDASIAHGSELWQIPDITKLNLIHPPLVKDNDPSYQPYLRDPATLSRYWAIPGQPGLRHRIGGIEKTDITGEISYDTYNHEKMVKIREEKVQRISKYIPPLEVIGEETGDLLVVGWGGTYGALLSAVNELQKEKNRISLAQFEYIKPLPDNTAKVFAKFKRIVVCELNLGQFMGYLRSQLPQFTYQPYHKIQGVPFLVDELKIVFNQVLNEINKPKKIDDKYL